MQLIISLRGTGIILTIDASRLSLTVLTELTQLPLNWPGGCDLQPVSGINQI